MSCRQPTPKKVQWVARHLFVTKLLEYIVSIKIIFFLAEKDRGRQRNVISSSLTFLWRGFSDIGSSLFRQPRTQESRVRLQGPGAEHSSDKSGTYPLSNIIMFIT